MQDELAIKRAEDEYFRFSDVLQADENTTENIICADNAMRKTYAVDDHRRESIIGSIANTPNEAKISKLNPQNKGCVNSGQDGTNGGEFNNLKDTYSTISDENVKPRVGDNFENRSTETSDMNAKEPKSPIQKTVRKRVIFEIH